METDRFDYLQLEIIVSPDVAREYESRLVEVAYVMPQVVMPWVVTDPVYSRNGGQLGGAATLVQAAAFRAASNRKDGEIEQNQRRYEELKQMRSAYHDPAKAVMQVVAINDGLPILPDLPSAYTLTVTTRDEILRNPGNFSDESTRSRFERLRRVPGWIIYVMDAQKGLIWTEKRTTNKIDRAFEGVTETNVRTAMNPDQAPSGDVQLVSGVYGLKKLLFRKGLLTLDEDGLDPGIRRTGSQPDRPVETRTGHPTGPIIVAEKSSKHDLDPSRAAARQRFLEDDREPLNYDMSLESLKDWVNQEGSFAWHNRDYLMAVISIMDRSQRLGRPSDRRAALKALRENLADAVDDGLENHVATEFIRFINNMPALRRKK